MKKFIKIEDDKEDEIICSAGMEYCFITPRNQIYRCISNFCNNIKCFNLDNYTEFIEYYRNNDKCEFFNCQWRKCDEYYVQIWKKNKCINNIFPWHRKLYSLPTKSFEHFFIQLSPVAGCPNRCHYCSITKQNLTKPTHYIDTTKLSNFVNYIANNYNNKLITIAGEGEPLSHPQIDNIFNNLIKNNFKVILFTSGLIHTDRLYTYKDISKIHSICISLHPSSCNWNLNKITLFLEFIKSKNVECSLSIVNHESNIPHIDSLKKLSSDINPNWKFNIYDYIDTSK